MNHVAATKSVSKAEVAVTSSATHSLEIDTLGFANASIDVLFSPFTAASPPTTAATVLRVAQSDTSGSGQVNISGFVGGATNDFAITAGVTATASVGYAHRFDIDLRGKRRYLTVFATPASTSTVITSCRLSKAEAGPMSASEKNVNTQAVG
jgi:hypothetical protein